MLDRLSEFLSYNVADLSVYDSRKRLDDICYFSEDLLHMYSYVYGLVFSDINMIFSSLSLYEAVSSYLSTI